jgi:hypothetical protein
MRSKMPNCNATMRSALPEYRSALFSGKSYYNPQEQEQQEQQEQQHQQSPRNLPSCG